ncbi:hypothetical protein OG215_42180 (plasmid) [Streptomyces globisporus]|uniref:hypothetical protein n=1 Tax=Streptomyces globisporus TaxID=1908 RepID=UPI002F911DEB|nr:hypothetical protein OG215_42180 [Streptomyces globisporus]
MLVVELANQTPGSDAAAEVMRLHRLWDEAAQVDTPPQATPPQATPPQATPPQAESAPYAGQVATLPQAAAVAAGRSLRMPLVLAELEEFGSRNEGEQAVARRMLYELFERVGWGLSARRERLDRGDSVAHVFDPALPVARILRALLRVLPECLHESNHRMLRPDWFRLRLVLATSSVTVDGHLGAEMIEASRLLDSDVLRAALRERSDNYVLCVPETAYFELLLQEGGLPAAAFRETAFHDKSGTRRAWIYQNGQTLNK